jgi:hypothetical protein
LIYKVEKREGEGELETVGGLIDPREISPLRKPTIRQEDEWEEQFGFALVEMTEREELALARPRGAAFIDTRFRRRVSF